MDHEPLSEFDHFFSETYVGDGAGFFDGCEWIQEAKNNNNNKNKNSGNSGSGGNKGGGNSGSSSTHSYSQSTWNNTELVIKGDDGKVIHTDHWYHSFDEKELEQSTTTSHGDTKERTVDPNGNVTTKNGTAGKNISQDNDQTTRTFTKADAEAATAAARKDAYDAWFKTNSAEAKANLKHAEQQAALTEKQNQAYDANLEKAAKAAQTRANNANAEATEKKNRDYEEDHERQVAKDEAEIENKKASTAKTKAEIEKLQRQGKWDEEDRELDKAKKLNDARVKTPQFLDESKIQKLNTMKPLMMSVDLNVVDKNGSLSRPVSYVIGVKCHTRLIDSSILPEVAAYPLKEMNKQLRKIKWRSGELKFGRDLLWKVKSKKQTASDARDKKRKWYRRLYELSHMSGDGVAAASIKNGKSPWANWWQDKLTGGNNKDVGHGLIPNATIIMSKSDIDNIKREKDIDLLSGSKAAKMCKELFLIGMVVIDEDAESVKVLFPDLHNDYDVMSIAAVKKQLAQLDTAGTKTRDIMKLLG